MRTLIILLLTTSMILVSSLNCAHNMPIYRNENKISCPEIGFKDVLTCQKLPAVLDSCINKFSIPGLQLAIRLPNDDICSISRGTLTPQRKQQIRHDHILRIGSISKIFTATLVFKAVERGELSLSDTLAKWFPGMPNSEKITVVELLNHTSGLREILESFSVKIKSIFPHKIWKPSELEKVISKQKPYFKPGAAFHYSNSNYILLGFILEKVTGKPIKQLLEEDILAPLELNNTFFLPDESTPKNLVTGFDRDLLPWPGLYENKPDNTNWASLAYTSGAMAATAADLAKFIDCFFNGKLLSEISMEEILKFVAINQDEHQNWTGYGAGVTQFSINSEEYWGHEGLFIGFEAIVLYSPIKKYSIALIGNISSFDRLEIIRQIQGILHAALIE